jgi:DNA primase
MMNSNAKETIRAKLPIESVVGSYIKLEKSGKNFRACCPFHGEKTPSFYVTPDRGIYYCYGCHKGGDIFSFVQEIEGVEFYDALKTLAEKAGVSLKNQSTEKPSRISVLRDVMESATRFYEVGLRTNKEPVDYLLNRGVTKETMIQWRIGYSAPGWSHLYDHLKNKFSDQDILATGLCITGQRGLYDRFRERIMFPISDGQGRVIAFTGRILPGTEEATRPVGKYINSPETDLYHKSSVLFGFDKAKTNIHSENFVIIVEGQMDCVMSHQSGITNVVALSGTACTDHHIDQIKRFTDNIAICLDADQAGLAAAQKTAMVAYSHDMKVLVIDVPTGKDPADLIVTDSSQWKQTVAHRIDFITFRLEKMKQQGKLGDKISIAEKELFPVMRHIQSQIAVDDRLQQIAHAFGMSRIDPVREEYLKFLRNHEQEQKPISAAPLPKKSAVDLERQLLGILLLIKESDSYIDLKNKFELLAGPIESKIANLPEQIQQELQFQTELNYGSAADPLTAYIRTFHEQLTRYEIEIIDKELLALSRMQRDDPQNESLLKRSYELRVRKDELIRARH